MFVFLFYNEKLNLLDKNWFNEINQVSDFVKYLFKL
jgi:hypothetical protein